MPLRQCSTSKGGAPALPLPSRFVSAFGLSQLVDRRQAPLRHEPQRSRIAHLRLRRLAQRHAVEKALLRRRVIRAVQQGLRLAIHPPDFRQQARFRAQDRVFRHKGTGRSRENGGKGYR